MKTFKQYINEIFDNPYDYNILKDSKYHYSGYFLTEEEKLLFSVDVGEIVEKKNIVAEVGFNAHPDYKSEMRKYFKLKPPFDKESFEKYFNSDRGTITDEKLDADTKHVSRIFATVIKIAEEYYNKFKPDTLIFRAKNSEANRVSLYTRMAKVFANKYKDENNKPIFNLSVKPSDDDSTIFELTKR